MFKVSIIIPNWNGAEKLRKNLPGVLAAARYKSPLAKVVEVIVVDDASTDNSLEVLKNEFPEVKVIAKEFNSGFSSTVNLGVENAQGDLVVQLNSDARPWENFLRFAVPHFENPKVFSVGCNVGGVWNLATWHDGYLWHQQATREVDKSKAHLTLWASGGSGIFRRELWQEFGGLDELFNPFYEEDMDLGYRATKRGYINLWEPKSLVDHYKEKGVIATHFTEKTVAKTAQRNQLLFIWKNISSPKMIVQHKRALARMLIIHPRYWQIFWAAWQRRKALGIKREIERKAAKLTDEEVLALFTS